MLLILEKLRDAVQEIINATRSGTLVDQTALDTAQALLAEIDAMIVEFGA